MIPERSSGTTPVPGTMHLFFEGYSTECKYFEKIEKSRLRVVENPKYLLKPEPRDLSQISASSPKDVLNFLKDTKKWIESDDRDICPIDLFIIKYPRNG